MVIRTLERINHTVFQNGSRTLFDVTNRYKKSAVADGAYVCYDFGFPIF